MIESKIPNGPIEVMMAILRPDWRDALALLVGYVALDWVSYMYPLYGLNITPWSPALGWALVFLLRYGYRVVLPLAFAIVVAEVLVRRVPASFAVTLSVAVLVTFGYWAVADVLRRHLHGVEIFTDRTGLLKWIAVVTIGTLLMSAIFVIALTYSALVPVEGFGAAFARYWVGDLVGALVSMPIFWMALNEEGRAQLRATVMSWDSVAYIVASMIALWIAFGIGRAADFKYFYVLFLPIAWAAARQGLAGAVLASALMQVGIIFAVRWLEVSAVTVLELQVLAIVLALSGFFIGIVVDEKQRVSADLKQSLRLAAAGEMTGAIAHELNQPLTALSAYGTACQELLKRGDTGPQFRESVDRMVAESFRAAEVVRRLRDFFRTGATRLECIELGEVLEQAIRSHASKAEQLGILLTLQVSGTLPVLADKLQLEVVLRNLLSNAFDVVTALPRDTRKVNVTTQRDTLGRVIVHIDDSGPGLSDVNSTRVFETFQTSKSSGLGLGLTISRAIVEAHGGKLWAEVAQHGAFRLMLPLEESSDER